jgi:hypothetical protein
MVSRGSLFRRSRPWAQAGSLRFPGHPSYAFALFQDPGRAERTSSVTVLPVLPPDPTDRRLSALHDFGATPGLQHPLSTLHERRCRRPCKTRFRLAGCAFTGRGANPLDDFERFQVLHSRACPDASWVHSERLRQKLMPATPRQVQQVKTVQELVWCFYKALDLMYRGVCVEP